MMSTSSKGVGGVRRLFQYAVLLALVIVVTVGVEGLLRRALDASSEWVDVDALLARSLAFVIVGGLLAGFLIRWTLRGHRVAPEERDSRLFSAYLTVAAITGLVNAAMALQELITSSVIARGLEVHALPTFIAWGLLWIGHFVWARRSLTDPRGSLHLLAGSVLGLVIGAVGLVALLGGSLQVLSGTLVPDPPAVLGAAAGTLLIGALIWALYWVGNAVALPRRILWLLVVLPIGVGGGLVLALTAASRLLWSVLVWFLGDPAGPAGLHFRSVWTEIAAVGAGLLVWWYHRTVLGGTERSEARRIYEYLVTGTALVAAAAGVATVVVALIEAVTPGVDVGMSVTNTLLAALTLLVVGSPVWWVFWGRSGRAIVVDPLAERSSLTRRVYLVAVLGISGVATVIGAITAGVLIFDDAVQSTLGASTLRVARVSLGTLLAAGAVALYHWSVFREDRADGADRVPGPRSVLLIGAAPGAAARELARATGARVETRTMVGAEADWDVARLVEVLAGHEDRDVVVLAEDTGYRVLDVTA